jgi:hypothetical protein
LCEGSGSHSYSKADGYAHCDAETNGNTYFDSCSEPHTHFLPFSNTYFDPFFPPDADSDDRSHRTVSDGAFSQR